MILQSIGKHLADLSETFGQGRIVGAAAVGCVGFVGFVGFFCVLLLLMMGR